MIEEGYADFATRWTPILDAYSKIGVRYCLEVHPTEIAFDIASARKALNAVNNQYKPPIRKNCPLTMAAS